MKRLLPVLMGFFMILAWGFPEPAHGVAVGLDGIQVAGTHQYPCYSLADISLTSEGYVRLTFGYNDK